MNQTETKFEDIPTPRTDVNVVGNSALCDEGWGDSPYVLSDFARQLERELHIAKESLKSIKIELTKSEKKKFKFILQGAINNLAEQLGQTQKGFMREEYIKAGIREMASHIEQKINFR